jgi:nicotinamide-nucleotide amidase
MVKAQVEKIYNLLNGRYTLAVAESFTGGGVCYELVKYAGMSAVLKKGLVCYSNESKIADLGVDKSTIDNYGAVSENTLECMLDGLIRQGFDCAIATTGNAGPTAEKDGEVGVCFVGVALKGKKTVKKIFLSDDREQVIEKGIDEALCLAASLFENIIEKNF